MKKILAPLLLIITASVQSKPVGIDQWYELSMCLDASFAQGRQTYSKFADVWKESTARSSAADKHEMTGRDSRKSQMRRSGTTREQQRVINYKRYDCEKFIK